MSGVKEVSTLTASESIYAFNAWLTTRNAKVKLGAKYDCVPIITLIDEFCKVNNLQKPRENYQDYFIMPK